MPPPQKPARSPFLAVILLIAALALKAHEHLPVTHNFDTAHAPSGQTLRIKVVDATTGALLSSRVSFQVDGADYVPEYVNEHGLRFTSIHKRSQHSFTATYALKSGPLVVDLPEGSEKITITATHGFEYRPATIDAVADTEEPNIIQLHRWTDLTDRGWIAIDEHLHFDRLDPADDKLWLAMLEADGLNMGHFMVLKGGMTPGIWSRQFNYGPAGRATNSFQSIIPGQEYRDSAQGHINLLGLNQPIEPYSTGGMGWPAVVENYPPLHDVLAEAKARNGFVGVAHGGSLGKHATAVADAVLGKVDFWEISNGFIYQTDTWYRLMNCGYFLPPMAGTDLPNSPYRDPWQPFFGSIRTYLHSDGQVDFESFKTAAAKGRVFITGGPIIDLVVEGKSMGETVELPEPGFITVRAEISSPRPIRELGLVRNGKPLEVRIQKSVDQGIHRWVLEQEVPIEQSGWIAAWGKGAAIKAQNFDAMAHTNVVRIHVGDQPIHSSSDADYFLQQLQESRAYYQEKGAYKSDTQRTRAVDLLDNAIAELIERHK